MENPGFDTEALVLEVSSSGEGESKGLQLPGGGCSKEK